MASGGTKPTSVAIHGGIAEVLNADGTANVTGFRATENGLVPIAGGRLLVADDGANGTSAVSPYRITPNGTLSATQAAVMGNTSAGTGAKPLDDAVSSDGSNLYVLDASNDQLAEFSVGASAQLTAIGTQALPAGSAGVAAS